MHLKSVMNVVVETVNFIRSSSLNHHHFKKLSAEAEADCGDVLYFTLIRWLSCGATLKWFFDLRSEISDFLRNKGHELPELFNPLWLFDLAYIVDVTTHLNKLNKTLQGKTSMCHICLKTFVHFNASWFCWRLNFIFNHLFLISRPAVPYMRWDTTMSTFPILGRNTLICCISCVMNLEIALWTSYCLTLNLIIAWLFRKWTSARCRSELIPPMRLLTASEMCKCIYAE